MCESRTWDAPQTIKLYKSASIYKFYYSILFNLAPSVTHYQLAEILILAGPRFECDIQIYLAGRGKFCARSLQIVHCILNYIYYLHNACKPNKWASGIFFVFFDPIFRIFRWFQHFTKICITCITFWWFWALHDVSLPNWMKYYSTREPILQKKMSCSLLFAWLPFYTITTFFQSGSWFSWLNAGCSCMGF